jgi:hypothetical protein
MTGQTATEAECVHQYTAVCGVSYPRGAFSCSSALGYSDTYKLTLNIGTTVTAYASDYPGLPDSAGMEVVTVTDPSGNIVATGSYAFFSRVDFTAAASGVYLIGVVSEFNHSYELSVACGGGSPVLTCSPDDNTLCLNNGRFGVSTTWQTATEVGAGTATALTNDTGIFWFFSASNVEVVAKVLNACQAPFNRYWVFAGGLTNVAATMTVTDTQANQFRIYKNPQGAAFQPIQDTSAFATCP